MEQLRSAQMKKWITSAMFAAIIAVLSQIAIPMPAGVPVTLQTFAIALCGYILGWRFGLAATLLYLMIGAVGAPVFASFSGGIGVLFGMTGGYLSGFLFMAVLCGLGANCLSKVAAAGLGLAGLALCHALGVVQFAAVTGSSMLYAFTVASLSYLIKDVVSVAIAYFVSLVVRRRLHAAGFTES